MKNENLLHLLVHVRLLYNCVIFNPSCLAGYFYRTKSIVYRVDLCIYVHIVRGNKEIMT